LKAGLKGSAAYDRAAKARQEAAAGKIPTARLEAPQAPQPPQAESPEAPEPAAAAEPGKAESEEEKETTYSFVGRSGPPSKVRSAPAPASKPPPKSTPPPRAKMPSRSVPPGRSAPPPARRGAGALPLKKKVPGTQPVAGQSARFGSRFVTDSRFDELVISFFSSR
jgi:hypothetical protein